MKHPFTNKSAACVAVLLAMLVGCTKPAEVTPTEPTCQLTSSQSVSQSNNGPAYQSQITYTYNAAGQLVGSISTASSLTTTYTYDAADKLTTERSQGGGLDLTITYAYTAGRITKVTWTSTGSDFGGTSVGQYSYDQAGMVTTFARTSLFYGQPSSLSYTFANGMLTGGSSTEQGVSRTITAINGRIASILSTQGAGERFAYDPDGYLIRQEYVGDGGRLRSYVVLDYNSTTYKQSNQLYGFLPFPKLYGNTERRVSRRASYQADGTLTSETRYQFQANAQGYLAHSDYSTTDYEKGTSTTGTNRYVYANCP